MDFNPLSADLLRTDIYSLMGMSDASMDENNPLGSTCIFNGIQATLNETEGPLKFAGRVVFGDEVVRHVLFDVDGQVVSLGFIDHSDDADNENDAHELVFVRNDCTLLRQNS